MAAGKPNPAATCLFLPQEQLGEAEGNHGRGAGCCRTPTEPLRPCAPCPGRGVAAGRPTCREWGMPDDDGPQAPRGSRAPSRFGPVCLEAGLPQLPAPQERGLGQRRRGTRETPLSVLTAAAARLWSATISQRGRRSRSAPAAPRAGLVRAALAALRPGVAIRRAGGGGQSCWAGALLSRGGGRE